MAFISILRVTLNKVNKTRISPHSRLFFRYNQTIGVGGWSTKIKTLMNKMTLKMPCNYFYPSFSSRAHFQLKLLKKLARVLVEIQFLHSFFISLAAKRLIWILISIPPPKKATNRTLINKCCEFHYFSPALDSPLIY